MPSSVIRDSGRPIAAAVTNARPKGEDLAAAIDAKFTKLIGKRVLSPAYATREMDGRLVPFVLVTVFDDDRKPIGRVGLELRDSNGTLVDTTRTSAGGVGILLFPVRTPRGERNADERSRITVLADGAAISGTVHLLNADAEPKEQAVSIPPHKQVARAMFLVPKGFTLDADLPPGDDPLTRLPIDFSEDACNALLGARANGLLDPNNLTTRADPLLNAPTGVKTIAGKRMPIVRRLDVVRYGPDEKRYLVRLRQEWVLLTYTLGELAQVQALDPGAVLQSAEQFVSQVTSVAREAVDTARSTLTSTLQDALSSLGAIDSVVRTVANATAHAGGSGWAIGIPGLFGYGTADVDANAHLDMSVNTNVNTSLLVNRAVQQASTLVNEAIAKVHAVAEGTQRTASDVINHLAPLVSQVANALHWRVYEVYAVCTNVDAVHPIEELDLFADPLADFTAEEVLAYRPFFERALLDRTLVRLYDALLHSAALPPLLQATVRVTCDSDFRVFGFPVAAQLTMQLDGVTRTTVVPSGGPRTVTLHFQFPASAPLRRGTPVNATFLLERTAGFGTGTGTVRRIEVWIDRPLSGPGVTIDSPSSPFQIPLDLGVIGADVLVRHVNLNKHYYYGILAAAAIGVPSLRDDVVALTSLDSRLWRLPLMGMEGTKALLLLPETETLDAHTLLDDLGAGTLVQILAPGSYGEILTGLLQIPLDTLHPLMQEIPTVSPFGVFPNLAIGALTSPVSGALGAVSAAGANVLSP